MEDYTLAFLTGLRLCEEFALSKDFVRVDQFDDSNAIKVTVQPEWFDPLIDRIPEPWICSGFKKTTFYSPRKEKDCPLIEMYFALMYEDFPPEGLEGVA